jgi:hypothetical protein
VHESTGGVDQSVVYTGGGGVPDVASWLAVALDQNGDGFLVGQSLPLSAGQDTDGDGIPNPGLYADLGDNCAGVANADQADDDCDGVGNLCDATPSDLDRDTIPDASDNCPYNFNLDQANCNADMEPIVGAPVRGDVCDYNPCPDTRLPTIFAPASSGFTTDAVWNNEVTTLGLVGIHSRAGVTGSTPKGNVRTGYRWCDCPTTADTVDARLLCSGSSSCVRTASHYSLPFGTSWHPMTILAPTHAADAAGEYLLAYDRANVPPGVRVSDAFGAHWDFEGDAGPLGVLTDTTSGTSRHRFTEGVVWAHATEYEYPGPGVGIGCTADMILADCAALTNPDLNSHYVSGRFGRRETSAPASPWPFLGPLIGNFIPEDVCPECREAFPLPLPTSRICAGQPCSDPEVYVRFAQGSSVRLTHLLGSQFYAALAATTNRWIAPVEDARMLGPSSVRYVGVNPTANSVTFRALAATGLLNGAGPGSGGSSVSFSGASQITGAGFLFRSSSNIVWMVGGMQSGSPATAARSVNLTTLAQSTRSLTGTLPRTVVAASLHFTENAAVVIDEFQSKYRVVYVDLTSGVCTKLGEYTKTNTFNSFALAALRDGQLALGSSRADGTAHRLVTFEATPSRGIVEWRYATGSGKIEPGPLATSVDGLTVAVTLVGAQEWRPVGYRYGSLTVASLGSLSASF